MQLEEFKKLKKNYELKLRLLVRDFEAETGVQISEIHIEYVKTRYIDKVTPDYILDDVHIDCRI